MTTPAPGPVPPPPGAGYAVPYSAYPPGHPLAPAVAPNGMRLAEFGDRLVAYLIDSLILGAISMAVFIPVLVAFVAATFDSTGSAEEAGTFLLGMLCLEAVLLLFQLALMYGYFVTYQVRKGQTVGKRVMKIKIVPLDPAAQLAPRLYQRRFVAGPLAAIIPGYGMLDGLWQLWDKPFRQCLHDRFAGTVVVKLPPG
ncbi:hypothetical protein GCM10009682_18660 [Luedemannella flava]|uniref:RDD domain-containing protein n=1 Tax=Luedemannella flava TaxID=349316 RepID=A0ABP4XYA0_9ACTN